MKRYGNLYKRICSIRNLHRAYNNAKRGKGWYEEVKMIEKRPYYYLYGLQYLLENYLYHTSEYEIFQKVELRKTRDIYKLPFYPDRICQWAVIQVIEPILLKNMTCDTYSALPFRGIHAAYRKLRSAVDDHADEMTYCLKLDCKKLYPSIDHDILKAKYRRKFKDPELLWLIDEIIDSISTCPATEENIEFYGRNGKPINIVYYNNQPYIEGIGIPIGNYFSQYDANFYLTEFDHYIKEVKHVKHYFRYMDDMLIFAETKEELHDLFNDIHKYFDEKLNLRIKDNWQIFPSFVRGVDFVGYRVFKDHTMLRKTTCKSMEKKLTAIRVKTENGDEINRSEWCSINSYKGWLKHCNSYYLSKKYISPVQPYADEYYVNHIKKKGGKSDEGLPERSEYRKA